MPTGPDPWCSLPRAQGKVFTHRFHCLSKRANVLFSDQTPTSLRHRNEAKAGSSHGGGMVQCAWGLRRVFLALAPYQPRTYRFPREAAF
jgi:hypothetical protein